jgi:DNA (cytosine-5)-methyltransferase 1
MTSRSTQARTGSTRRKLREAELFPFESRRSPAPSSIAPRVDPLAVAGLFAGIGGIELGLSRSGHASELLCEIEDSACAVLEKRFPGARLHRDVRALRSIPRRVELLTAGFPCQDLSQAGMTRGIGGDRSGLIGEVFALLERRRIPWVLLENVPFMLQLAKGRALDVIVSELERLGYRWAYRVVDSRSFGLPQRRQRVYLLASREGDPRDILLADDAGDREDPAPSRRRSYGFYWTEGIRGLGTAIDAIPTLKGGSTIGIPSPPAIVLPSGRVVTPDILDAERLQGFDSGWTAPAAEASRRAGARWKLVGNAVTVDVAEWIGRRLRAPASYDPSEAAPLIRRSGAWPTAAWNVGSGRFRSFVSRWPAAVEGEPIHDFLRHEPALLSPRATEGFLRRLRSGSLRYPDWFEGVLERHRERTTRQA